eukprot:1146872-Pelagomonas_calceolata.AAC.6
MRSSASSTRALQSVERARACCSRNQESTMPCSNAGSLCGCAGPVIGKQRGVSAPACTLAQVSTWQHTCICRCLHLLCVMPHLTLTRNKQGCHEMHSFVRMHIRMQA